MTPSWRSGVETQKGNARNAEESRNSKVFGIIAASAEPWTNPVLVVPLLEADKWAIFAHVDQRMFAGCLVLIIESPPCSMLLGLEDWISTYITTPARGNTPYCKWTARHECA